MLNISKTNSYLGQWILVSIQNLQTKVQKDRRGITDVYTPARPPISTKDALGAWGKAVE